MNDSFLEELELLPKEAKKSSQVDRHITTRHATSSPLLHFSEQSERDNVKRSQKDPDIVTTPIIPDVKITSSKDSSRDSKKQLDQNVKRHSVNIKVSEKPDKVTGKPVDVRTKMDNEKQQSISGEHKVKSQDVKYLKMPENKIRNKDRNRHSGSHKETTHSLNTSTKENRRSPDSLNSHSSDTSSKENSRPSDSSKETGFRDSIKEKGKLPDKSKKSVFKIQDQDPVALLTAIKELISTYTKQESTKILRTMQELHVNSQATLIKSLLDQTDDLIIEMHPSKDSARVRALVEENERLQQELIALRMQNEDLQNKLEKLEFLKQENTMN
ncbi:peptidyl-prolyl cis-trans isomerase G-like [Linepithema humile]|uniref:peptidyl-prolyl cis-trans isomerase G-like n=1 Tax=Linepithema humile TaxID=83485 RepID=UPI0006239C17|nr:PREDICTED: uncharacterized protein LOC105676561 [Linepithema humile]XP_012229991.1 PREDICTED: uncharacterized protein LOC105676561 [Linepithema humile]